MYTILLFILVNIHSTHYQPSSKNEPCFELSSSLNFDNLYFEKGSLNISEKAKIKLSELCDYLTENPTEKIEVSGHTDS
jgi:outer membrane protein OmpA-like peptidoglycan-associated protein